MEDKDAKNVLPDILDIQTAKVSFDINLEDFFLSEKEKEIVVEFISKFLKSLKFLSHY